MFTCWWSLWLYSLFFLLSISCKINVFFRFFPFPLRWMRGDVLTGGFSFRSLPHRLSSSLQLIPPFFIGPLKTTIIPPQGADTLGELDDSYFIKWTNFFKVSEARAAVIHVKLFQHCYCQTWSYLTHHWSVQWFIIFWQCGSISNVTPKDGRIQVNTAKLFAQCSITVPVIARKMKSHLKTKAVFQEQGVTHFPQSWSGKNFPYRNRWQAVAEQNTDISFSVWDHEMEEGSVLSLSFSPSPLHLWKSARERDINVG